MADNFDFLKNFTNMFGTNGNDLDSAANANPIIKQGLANLQSQANILTKQSALQDFNYHSQITNLMTQATNSRIALNAQLGAQNISGGFNARQVAANNIAIANKFAQLQTNATASQLQGQQAGAQLANEVNTLIQTNKNVGV